MALESWQKITRVLPGQPFGDGADGDYNSATIPTLIKLSCSGSASSTSLTASSTTLADGDIVLIHQTRGTGVGQWEINRIASGGGTVNLVMQEALQYTYTDSGASQAQIIKVFRFNNCVIASGTWNVPTWDGDVGGIFPLAVKRTLTPTGTISRVGGNNVGGFLGASTPSISSAGKQAEGTSGARDTITTAANGNGGGGGSRTDDSNRGGGGGGGNGSAGTTGSKIGSGTGGAGGATAGSDSLVNMVMGGGGGQHSTSGGSGGSGLNAGGGGIVVLFAKNISSISGVTVAGAAGVGTAAGGGGGGAGGSILICAQSVDIGTDKLNTAGGAGSTAASPTGGNGGKGRIAIYYGSSLSGSVSSTYYGTLTSEQDTSLVEQSGGGAFLLNFV